MNTQSIAIPKVSYTFVQLHLSNNPVSHLLYIAAAVFLAVLIGITVNVLPLFVLPLFVYHIVLQELQCLYMVVVTYSRFHGFYNTIHCSSRH